MTGKAEVVAAGGMHAKAGADNAIQPPPLPCTVISLARPLLSLALSKAH
jgi:hypothetical protein